MQYKEAVAEARRLVKRSEEDQWRLAQLTWEQLRTGISQRQWAEDVGVDPRTARRWRDIWERWGEAPAPRPSYSEAFQAIDKGLDVENVYAERHQMEAQRTIRNLPAGEKAAVVREALEDPQVADEIVRDERAAAGITDARMRLHKQHVESARQQYELTEPRSHQLGAIADLEYAATKARQGFEDVSEAVEKLTGNWPDEATRERAVVLIQRALAAGELAKARVLGEDLDAELQALLEGGDA